MMKRFVVVIVALLLVFLKANKPCQSVHDWSIRNFHKIKKCHRSNQAVISKINARSLRECIDVAKERGGLAINFSPPEATITTSYQDYYFVNCQILGCPEIGNLTLTKDITFDYYSFFGDMEVNSSCVKSSGMFRVFEEKVNYSTAIMRCQDMGGDLAHILSESRTNGISSLVKQQLKAWYQIAYVGLDDKKTEGRFVTPLWEPLNCYKFRAWAPGHPRKKYPEEDCVVIDAENSWKVVNCQEELPFVCEIYPMALPRKTDNVGNIDCSQIKNKAKRRKCKQRKTKQRMPKQKINNTSIADRCQEEE